MFIDTSNDAKNSLYGLVLIFLFVFQMATVQMKIQQMKQTLNFIIYLKGNCLLNVSFLIMN